MPRKVRQAKAGLRKEGFYMEPGRGSHTKWFNELIPDIMVVISGNDGDDVQEYQEIQIRKALKALNEARRRLI